MNDLGGDVVLRPALPADREAAAAVLATAFADDAHTVGLLPPGRRLERLHRLFGVLVDETCAGAGEVWIAAEPGGGSSAGDTLGVALWELPGQPAARPRLASALGFLRVYGTRILDAARTDRSAHEHRPTEPHRYLKAIGTSPLARGRGVATALVRHGTEAAAQEGVGTYLESSSRANVAFYRRLGFEERGLVPAHGTPPTIGMWRH